MNVSTARRKLVFLGLIALLVFGLVSGETTFVFRLKEFSDGLLNQNIIQRQQNERTRAEIQGLTAIQAKISAMFVRLNDAVFSPRGAEGVVALPRPRVRALNGDERPPAIQMIADAGVVVQPARIVPGESSVIFEAGSSRLEFQRLIPLMAEQENSNAFLYFDRVLITRPTTAPPFSELPTYLEARFSIRILANR